jgi:adenylate cyclase
MMMHTGIHHNAKQYLLRSLQISRELGYPADIRNAAGNLQELYRKNRDWEQALLMNDLYIQMRDSVQNDKNRKASLRTEFKYEYEKKEAVVKSEAKAEITKQKLVRNGFIAGFVFVLLFAGVVANQRNKIQKGKKRSDELLLNILPEEVAEELKTKGYAEARQFDEATVMFTDFKGFTTISEKLSPAELVAEIDTCFKAFDRIISRYNIEKIKTIGDSYMCASGLPVPSDSHATDMVNAALEIQQFMLQHLQQRVLENKDIFEIRIGIHSGPVVAGIVGTKKFAYDIWGDTVNTASRMESSGEPGRVNISGSTYALVKESFNCVHRGKIAAKHKGEVDMYFVES